MQQLQSRRLFRTLHSLRNPGSLPPRHLYFRSAHFLTNRLGQEFELIMNWKRRPPLSCETYLILRDCCPHFGAFMKFTAHPGQDRVHIDSLKSFSSLYEIDQIDYYPPAPERKGYGYIRIAIFLAAHIANREDVSRLTIKPASVGVSKHYWSCGFIPTLSSSGLPWGNMVFPLRANGPRTGIGPAVPHLPAVRSAV